MEIKSQKKWNLTTKPVLVLVRDIVRCPSHQVGCVFSATQRSRNQNLGQLIPKMV